MPVEDEINREDKWKRGSGENDALQLFIRTMISSHSLTTLTRHGKPVRLHVSLHCSEELHLYILCKYKHYLEIWGIKEITEKLDVEATIRCICDADVKSSTGSSELSVTAVWFSPAATCSLQHLIIGTGMSGGVSRYLMCDIGLILCECSWSRMLGWGITDRRGWTRANIEDNNSC